MAVRLMDVDGLVPPGEIRLEVVVKHATCLPRRSVASGKIPLSGLRAMTE